MGKIDDMRRLREAQHDALEERAEAKKKATGAPAKAVVVVEESAPVNGAVANGAPTNGHANGHASNGAPAVTAAASEPSVATPAKKSKPKPVAEEAPKTNDEIGECSGCGKRKALVNGLVVNHQKGLGKMCPGSRKKPA